MFSDVKWSITVFIWGVEIRFINGSDASDWWEFSMYFHCFWLFCSPLESFTSQVDFYIHLHLFLFQTSLKPKYYIFNIWVAIDRSWSMISTDQSPGFGTHVICLLIAKFNYNRVKVNHLHVLTIYTSDWSERELEHRFDFSSMSSCAWTDILT